MHLALKLTTLSITQADKKDLTRELGKVSSELAQQHSIAVHVSQRYTLRLFAAPLVAPIWPACLCFQAPCLFCQMARDLVPLIEKLPFSVQEAGVGGSGGCL
jgi:hypothetical protein